MPYASRPLEDDHGVWLQRPEPITAPRLPIVDAALLGLVLTLLCGNGPAVLVQRVAGLPGVPVWPIYIVLYGAIGMLLWTRAGVAKHALAAGLPALGLTLLPLLSAVWSVTPLETSVQAATLAGTALCGFYLAAAVPVAQALRTLAFVATAAACLDLLAIIALPSVGIEQDGPWAGTWRGLHDQKNGLGAYAALQLLLLATYLRAERRLDPIALCGVLLSLFLLVAARSTTSWLTAFTCLPIVLAPRTALWIGGRLFVIGIACFIIALAIEPDIGTTLLQALPGLVGKDATLSNRLPVWSVLAPFIEAAPWLGYGYGAFWTEAYMPGDLFLSTIKFLPGSAHSSIVETRLGLGYLGVTALGLFVVSYVTALWRCDHPRVGDPDRRALAPLGHALFVFIVFQSLTESIAMTRNDLVWALVVYLATSLAMLSPRTSP
jgi:exopolysaccharide production protein ExoQ